MSLFHPYPEPKLTIELVPSGQWEDNLRSHLKKTKWDALRYACYQRANHKCEVCGEKGWKHPVECHEIWEYNDQTRIQKLNGLIALCPQCHQVKHIGLAAIKGKFAQAIGQLMKVNSWPQELAEAYAIRQFEIHQIRSTFAWSIDLSWLDDSEQYIEESVSLVRQRAAKHSESVLEAMTRKR